MKKQVVVAVAIVSVVAIFCGSIAISVDFFYDGGIVCLFSPKECRDNQEVAVIPETFPTVTPQPLSTLPPTPTQFLTPTLFLTSTPSLDLDDEFINRAEPENVNCGQNPYKYNNLGGLWERQFSAFCFEHVHDPFEAIFWGLDFDQVSAILERVDIDDLSKGEQLSRLEDLNLWNSQCNCVPEEAPGLSASLLVPVAPTPEPLDKDN